MTYTIDVTPDQEDALRAKAERMGLDVDAYLRRLIEAEAASELDAENEAVIRLLHEWREADAAMSPEEAEQAEAEWQQLKVNLNANRAATGERPVFP